MYAEKIQKYGTSSHGNQYVFYGDGPDYIGMEVEIDNRSTKNIEAFKESIAKILFTKDFSHLYFVEKDSSLWSGMELITQPHSIEAMRNFIDNKLSIILKEVKEAGAEPYCGRAALHFHVSRTKFGKLRQTQVDNLAKLEYFFSNHKDEFIKLGHRDCDCKCRFTNPLTVEMAKAKVHREIITRLYVSRYQMINLANRDTVEFRTFRNPLDLEDTKAILEIVWHLSTKCTEISWEDANKWDVWFEDAPQIAKDYIKRALK